MPSKPSRHEFESFVKEYSSLVDSVDLESVRILGILKRIESLEASIYGSPDARRMNLSHLLKLKEMKSVLADTYNGTKSMKRFKSRIRFASSIFEESLEEAKNG